MVDLAPPMRSLVHTHRSRFISVMTVDIAARVKPIARVKRVKLITLMMLISITSITSPMMCVLCASPCWSAPSETPTEQLAERATRQASSTQINPEQITLSDLARCARLNNPALRLASAELDKARATLTRAQLSRAPTLSVDGLLAPLPARRLLRYCVSDGALREGLEQIIVCPNQDIQDDARLGDTEGMGVFGRVSATLNQPLYTFGKISSGIDAARAGVRAYEALKASARHSLDMLAFQTYYGLTLSQRAQKTFRKGLKRLKRLRSKIQKELDQESGKYTSNDLRKLIIKESELVSARESVRAQEQRALYGVRLSCHLESAAQLKLDTRKMKPLEVTLETEAEYLKRARARRPQLIAAREQLNARRAQRSLAIAQFFPDLALIGTFNFARGTSAEDNPDPFANDPFNVFGYGAYLGMRWRLNFAQLTSRLESSGAEVARAQAQLDALEQRLALEINERYRDAVRYQRALEAQREAMVSGKQWMTSAMLSQGAGLIDTREALAAITGYFTTSLSYERHIYEYNLALARLWAASGEDPLRLIDSK